MERLTIKHNFELRGLDGKQYKASEVVLKSTGMPAENDEIREAYNKLAEFEDFMESFGCEELEEIEHLIGYPRFVDGYDEQENEINRIEFITYKESFNEVFEKNKKLKQENQALKEEIKILKGKLNE